MSLRNLLEEPLCRPEDLGAPMPDLPHANSVCLPTWRDVVGYEEKDPRVISRLRAGYPRFVMPPACSRLFELARPDVCSASEICHLYPSAPAAQRACRHILRWSGLTAEARPWRGLWAVCFPRAAEQPALKFWRHSGEGLSSRQAEAMLKGIEPAPAGEAAARLRERIARWTGSAPADVRLYPCGMAAIYAVHRCLTRLAPGRRVVQLGFPYVDTLKIVQDFGASSLFLPRADETDFGRLETEARREPFAGLFCEFPSNPTLISLDLHRLRAAADRWDFPVIIDDTIASWVHVDLLPFADALVTSLTKWFTGRGDVMLGSIVVNASRPWGRAIRDALESETDTPPWPECVALAEVLSRDFESRVRRAGESARTIAGWLQAHPKVAEVYYPALQHREHFDRARRADGGYGGLISFVLKDAPRASPLFYDALEVCKGPNLGTVFTLCCPFTLLAHYEELDWAEACGVSRWLLRLSIGQEPVEELIRRLDRAFGMI